jgi:predicted phosphodiesterase
MRVLVISDIHANITALEAVLADAGEADETWCLGDIIGYGPDPNECVEKVSRLANLTCVLGNHDVAVLGLMPLVAFNGDARLSLEWQIATLTPNNVEFLRSLPHEPIIYDEMTLVHGSPRDPVWEYILNMLSARINFQAFQTRWCLVGHTHLQMAFEYDPPTDRVLLNFIPAGEVYKLDRKAILNPGSVGQPRDRDPRAAYAIYETNDNTWQPRRVAYDFAAVQKRIRVAQLPERHALRLAEGW